MMSGDIKSKNELLIRDSTNNALINKNKLELEQYKASKMKRKEAADLKQRIDRLEKLVDKICKVLKIDQD